MALTLAGTYRFDAAPRTVWEMIFTPESLQDLIPGCRRLELVDDVTYHGEVIVGIAAVGGTYHTVVVIDEQVAPTIARLSGEISGPTGIIKGTAHFTLEGDNGQTQFEYAGNAMITGALAHMNDRFVHGVAMALIQQGLHRLERRLAAAESPA